ncbi:hypothetical protein RUM44_009181 [Polyplax serrata]|uniref:Trichohyalin-like n=1 Tax=Polyplax serrata TaxID=468196 RepID=A0ABR1AS02_POLSC
MWVTVVEQQPIRSNQSGSEEEKDEFEERERAFAQGKAHVIERPREKLAEEQNESRGRGEDRGCQRKRKRYDVKFRKSKATAGFLSEKHDTENVESPRKKKYFDRNRGTKFQKKNSIYIDLRPFRKSKTSREPVEVKPEMSRFLKSTDKLGRTESIVAWTKDNERSGKVVDKVWRNPHYPTIDKTNLGEPGKEERRSKMYRRHRKEWSRPAEEITANLQDSLKQARDSMVAWRRKKKKSDVRAHPFEYQLSSEEHKPTRRSGADENAIVIYERQNRNSNMEPNFTGGYQLEQFSFTGSCETTIDVTQSKRSLSEPRQKAVNEIYVTRRRTRVQIKPEKVFAGSSDHHSTFNVVHIRENQDTSEDVCQHLGTGTKCTTVANTKSDLRKENVEKRLMETAQKKLDLHREMRRLERMNRKKFWESIKQSLNYRCALADMFSSQSVMSQDESAKFFSSTENSTEIIVHQGVIEKISSYQGFHRMGNVNVGSPRLTNKPGATIHQVKTMLGSMLINEDKEFLPGKNERLPVSCSSRESLFTETSVFPNSASEKFSMMENCLNNSSSELQSLMEKLSKEINKCTEYVRKLHVYDTKKQNNEIGRSSENKEGLFLRSCMKTEKPQWETPEVTAFPIIFSQPSPQVSGQLKKSPGKGAIHVKDAESESDVESFRPEDTNGLEELDLRSEKLQLKETGKSDSSLKSFHSATISNDDFPKKRESRKDGMELCCQDCHHLKKRIVKLERDLAKIQKKMPFYPPEYKNSIQQSLEKLKATSETVLQRLKEFANMKYDSQCRKNKYCSSARYSRRSLSAPEPAVKKEVRRKMSLRGRNSDCNLNVGMAITMENTDPLTGERLHPEVSFNTEQEGNIQCRIFKDGDTPLLVMDTDFSYNPQTGMLFKKSKDKGEYEREVTIPASDSLRRNSSTVDILSKGITSQTYWGSYNCSCQRHYPFGASQNVEEYSYEKSRQSVDYTDDDQKSCPLPGSRRSQEAEDYLQAVQEARKCNSCRTDSCGRSIWDAESCLLRRHECNRWKEMQKEAERKEKQERKSRERMEKIERSKEKREKERMEKERRHREKKEEREERERERIRKEQDEREERERSRLRKENEKREEKEERERSRIRKENERREEREERERSRLRKESEKREEKEERERNRMTRENEKREEKEQRERSRMMKENEKREEREQRQRSRIRKENEKREEKEERERSRIRKENEKREEKEVKIKEKERREREKKEEKEWRDLEKDRKESEKKDEKHWRELERDRKERERREEKEEKERDLELRKERERREKQERKERRAMIKRRRREKIPLCKDRTFDTSSEKTDQSTNEESTNDVEEEVKAIEEAKASELEEEEKGKIMGARCIQKDSKRSMSRIPRPRKAAPSDSLSIEGSVTSTITRDDGEQIGSRNLSDQQSVKKVRIEQPRTRIWNRGTQTYEKDFPQLPPCTADVGTQTICWTEVKGDLISAGVQACTKTMYTKDASTDLEKCYFSLSEVSRVSQTETSSLNSSSVAVQTTKEKEDDKEKEKRKQRDVLINHIGLQTNLPTEENLKYINDLQMQKKVNMAIAELCFHLSKPKSAEDV